MTIQSSKDDSLFLMIEFFSMDLLSIIFILNLEPIVIRFSNHSNQTLYRYSLSNFLNRISYLIRKVGIRITIHIESHQ